jgi:hypothetical protein
METNRGDHRLPGPAAGMMLMMALMMGVCFGSVLLFSLIPVIGWPLGLVAAGIGFAVMFYMHQKLMGHHGQH